MRTRTMGRFLWILGLIWLPLQAEMPQITPYDVRNNLKKIMSAHFSYKTMSPKIMERAIENYIEELDPSKTYFLQEDLQAWLEPSPELLDQAIADFKAQKYPLFEEIHSKFLKALERRTFLEEKVNATSIEPAKKTSLVSNKLDWVKNQEELFDRLKHIRSLQLYVYNKFSEESQKKFFQRIEKQRKGREEKILGKTPDERQKWILVHVLKAMSSALDANTCYLTPDETRNFMSQLQQKIFGIGAVFRDNLNGFSVLRLIENSPASKELKLNDLIISVDDEPVIGLDIAEVAEKIRGEKGTKVKLTLLRDHPEQENKQEKLEILITRGEIVLEETRVESVYEPFGGENLVTLKLSSFYHDKNYSSSKDIRKNLEELKKEHKISGVILDLRNNAGGLLSEGVAVAGLFMDYGIVVSLKDENGKISHFRNTEPSKVWDGPLLILTNKASASAAEVVAQCLQDYGRALVIGDTRTFGKGTYQTFSLTHADPKKVNPKGEFKITRGKYYTVSGKSPQLIGVKADIEIPSLLIKAEVGEEFHKYPIENDSIEPRYEDALADLNLFHRMELLSTYQANQQKKLTDLEKFLPFLKKNSEERIKKNLLYQKALSDLEEQKFESEWVRAFELSDLQWIEAKNILKDLLTFEQKEALLAS